MTLDPPAPCLVHRLPLAPTFVGRESELTTLCGLWDAGLGGVVALVGLGGAGKTALAACFLERLLGPDTRLRPHGLFVWSFYQEPDAGLFLQEAYRYFGRAAATPARGSGLLHLLGEALASGGPHLLVLDGLERVQRQESDGGGAYGQVEDPLLKGLLLRAAEGMGQTAVLVTTRFPLTDLGPLAGHGYRHLDVGGLAVPAAVALLRRRGVQGDDAALAPLVEAYGAHPLTLDHLGGVIGHFLDGDPRRAPEAPTLATPGSDRQALRLARLLLAYEQHLPAAELALLCRLCLLRRSVTLEQIHQLFLCAPPVRLRTVRELPGRLVRFLSPGAYPEELPREEGAAVERLVQAGTSDPHHTDVLRLAEAVAACVEEALWSAPLAGPDRGFLEELVLAVAQVLARHEATREGDFAEVARLYMDSGLDVPSDQRPLPAEDREALRELCDRYLALRRHPLLPFTNPPTALEEAFAALGFGRKRAAPLEADLAPADILRAWQRVQQELRHLTAKHFILLGIRELCRLGQRKWAMAGPLAPLDAAEFRQVLDALVGRHLVLREANDAFSVHPAVRDHFGRLAQAKEGGVWHDQLRQRMVSLLRRPGKRLPEDRASLDLVEEAIYHALAAGRNEEAYALYSDVLGGLRHLGWKLGEMTRGLRILRGFDPCPDRWALGWYLRALGELEEAFAQNDLPFFRADIRLLQGRLPEVAAVGDSARTAVAAFLMGRTKELPPDLLGCAIPRDQLLLYLGRLERARKAAVFEQFYRHIGWEGDRARCLLMLAEVARRQADHSGFQTSMSAASRWILPSGSVEHLCLLHLTRARLGDEAAARAAEEGLRVARQCGLGLYHVELLFTAAQLSLGREELDTAEHLARTALDRATAADCQFMWGAAEAGHVLGRALAAQRRGPEARTVLTEALHLRRRLGDPRAVETKELLDRLLLS